MFLAHRYIEKLDDKVVGDDLKRYFTDLMRKLNNNTSFELPQLKKTIVTKWLKNQFTLGSYSYREVDSDPLNLSPSDLATPLKDEKGVPRVLFAGEATSDNYYTAVHGAMESGKKAADDIYDEIFNFK